MGLQRVGHEWTHTHELAVVKCLINVSRYHSIHFTDYNTKPERGEVTLSSHTSQIHLWQVILRHGVITNLWCFQSCLNSKPFEMLAFSKLVVMTPHYSHDIPVQNANLHLTYKEISDKSKLRAFLKITGPHSWQISRSWKTKQDNLTFQELKRLCNYIQHRSLKWLQS